MRQLQNEAVIAPADAHKRGCSLPTVDLYGPVHKGLRHALCEMIIRMAQTDAGDADRVRPLIDDLTGLLYLCEAHAEHENAFIHRALEARMAGGSAERAREHEAQRRAIAALHSLVIRVTDAPETSRPVLWRALQLRYADFVGDSLMHMSREEEQTQPELEARYTEAELNALHKQLVAAIGADEYVAFMRLMLGAASPTERSQLTAIVRESQPAAVQAQLLT